MKSIFIVTLGFLSSSAFAASWPENYARCAQGFWQSDRSINGAVNTDFTGNDRVPYLVFKAKKDGKDIFRILSAEGGSYFVPFQIKPSAQELLDVQQRSCVPVSSVNLKLPSATARGHERWFSVGMSRCLADPGTRETEASYSLESDVDINSSHKKTKLELNLPKTTEPIPLSERERWIYGLRKYGRNGDLSEVQTEMTPAVQAEAKAYLLKQLAELAKHFKGTQDGDDLPSFLPASSLDKDLVLKNLISCRDSLGPSDTDFVDQLNKIIASAPASRRPVQAPAAGAR